MKIADGQEVQIVFDALPGQTFQVRLNRSVRLFRSGMATLPTSSASVYWKALTACVGMTAEVEFSGIAR